MTDLYYFNVISNSRQIKKIVAHNIIEAAKKLKFMYGENAAFLKLEKSDKIIGAKK